MMTPTQTHMPTPTQNRPSRRAVTLGLGAAVAFGAFATPALAIVSEGKAKNLVIKIVDDINRVISSGKSQSAMIKDFAKIFAKYSDVPVIARYSLGVDARRASASQLRAYTKAFQGYIARKYGKRFREFIGGRIEVKSARTVKSFVEVKTTAYLKGQEPFEVKFLVSDKSGKPLFFNMFIEGINMLLSERQEIQAMLDKRKGNIDQLIKDLKKAG